jgi:hypothetical protein
MLTEWFTTEEHDSSLPAADGDSQRDPPDGHDGQRPRLDDLILDQHRTIDRDNAVFEVSL